MKPIHGARRSAIECRSTSDAETTTNTITTSFRSSVGSSNVARPSKAKANTTNTGRLTVNRRIENLAASERFSKTQRQFTAIAQQVGQAERRITRVLSSALLGRRPAYLGRWAAQTKTNTDSRSKVCRVFDGQPAFDAATTSGRIQHPKVKVHNS